MDKVVIVLVALLTVAWLPANCVRIDSASGTLIHSNALMEY